jgi:hypothetical protein
VVTPWPGAAACQDPAILRQKGDGKVVCVGLAVCTETQKPSSTFLTGQRLHLYTEFEVREEIRHPFVEVTLQSTSGQTFRLANPSARPTAPLPNRNAGAGDCLSFHHILHLGVEPGAYTVSLRLIGEIEPSSDRVRRTLHDHCELRNVGPVKVVSRIEELADQLDSADVLEAEVESLHSQLEGKQQQVVALHGAAQERLEQLVTLQEELQARLDLIDRQNKWLESSAAELREKQELIEILTQAAKERLDLINQQDAWLQSLRRDVQEKEEEIARLRAIAQERLAVIETLSAKHQPAESSQA